MLCGRDKAGEQVDKVLEPPRSATYDAGPLQRNEPRSRRFRRSGRDAMSGSAAWLRSASGRTRTAASIDRRTATVFAALAATLLLATGGGFWGRLPSGRRPLLALQGKDEAKPPAPETGKGEAGKPVMPDSVTVGGTVLICKVLDVTDELVVVQSAGGKVFLERGKVASIQRGLEEVAQKAQAVFERQAKQAKSEESWKKLAQFCSRYDLVPEHRRALRELLELDPENQAARLGLGEAQLDGKWLSEKEVELKLAEGFVLADGKLSRKPGESGTSTVVKTPAGPPPSFKILPRTKLSKSDERKIEELRELRTENAKRFRAKLEREYRPGTWNSHETKHFVVQCNSTLEVTKKYAVIMELIHEKLSRMFTSRTLRSQRAPVRIHANQEDFITSDPLGQWMGRGLGGYYRPDNQSITTYHGTFGFTGTTFSVLAHEGTHYYQGLVLQDFDNVPMWLIEGLAVYFGDGSKFDPETKSITIGLIPRDRLSHLQEKMAAKRHTKVEKLVAMTRYSGFSGSHYADAWGLIYFLVNHPSKKGEKLMKQYWAIGLERKLSKGDFLDLAERYFGSVEDLEKQYFDYIMSLKPPPAGEIKGDYFVSEHFQFEFKAPGAEWEFFEDAEDKNLLVGMMLPGSSAQVRLYFENNLENKKAPEYFDDYRKSYGKFFENFRHEEVEIAGLKGYKVSYTDTGKRPLSWELAEEGGRIVIRGGDDDDGGGDGSGGNDGGTDGGEGKEGKESGKNKKKAKEHRDIVKFLLVQVDGVAVIECSTKKGEIEPHQKLFDSLNKNFNLILIRRW
jgi:hypothetical protein